MNLTTLVSQILINGILFGTMYGIAAIGLSLIFGTMRIIFLAQGTVIVFLSYICWVFFTSLGIDPYLSLAIIVPLAIALGIGFYYGMFRNAAASGDENVSLLIAVGLMYLLENIMTVVWGPSAHTVLMSYRGVVFHPFGLVVRLTAIIALVLAILATIIVWLFLKRTRIGTAVRAAAEDMVSTTLLGINPNWVNAVAFAIGIGMTGVAGVSFATVYSFDPLFGFTFSLKALIALTLGGVGNIFGALAGGITLGVIESFSSYYLGSGWTEGVSFAVFLLVLAFMPQGLFGARGNVKKA